ncbi:TlpA family protein disulfide reductase [Glutamicibacter protophormiae]|uniref:TlpA family protein disulfide reductase n=1 Tax=Glutamicibacter protophormiae TaxID=37930 RepID=UPI00166E868E|nr:TlpA disulfide reductase family protein [Glutamicibacter protophormiae]QRQ77768.1 TlpA family protein disulfide reductase [Glutamicibacter protophormiae]GGL92869.1 thiol-disulfide isomerase [Glutamicibacter protophormiae]
MIDPVQNPRPLSRRTMLRTLVAAAAVVPLAACSPTEDNLTAQANSGDGKNYIAGDGAVQEYTPDRRTDAVEIKAETYQGTAVDLAEWQGQPAVLNFWYAACAPCRIEAPHLKELAEEFKGKVNFLGVNVRDEAEAAMAFERTFEIPYESVQDTSGDIQLAMTKYVPLQAVPSTIILDRNGRVRARVIGAVEPSTLKSLISTALTEEL